MREGIHISAMRSALRRNGIWGWSAERLLQEWTDHVREDVASRVEGGADPATAETAAWHALGNPDHLAAHAAHELALGSWLGRHPWLAGLVLPVLTWFVTVVTLIVFTSQIGPMGEINLGIIHVSFDIVKWMPRLFNWGPWLLAILWLAWVFSRMPGGWKLFWITAVVLALCSTSFCMTLNPPVNGPGSGSLFVEGTGPGGLMLNAPLRLIIGKSYGPWSAYLFSGLTEWMQSLFLLAGALAVRFWAVNPPKPQPLRSLS